jgi:hypothetical protein
MWTHKTLICFAFLAAGLTSAPGQDASAVPGAPAYDGIALAPAGAPDLEIFDDFNGDGRGDLMLCDDRVFSVFIQADEGFGESPTFRMKAPEDAVFLDVGDIDGDGSREPVLMSARGVHRLVRFNEEYQYKLESVLDVENSFLPPLVGKLEFLDFLKDLTGDSKEELILPELSRFKIHRVDEEGRFLYWSEILFQPRANFFLEDLSQTGQMKEVVHLPCLFVSQERKVDVAVLFNGTSFTMLERNEEGAFVKRTERMLYKPDSREYAEESRAYFGKNVFYEDLTDDNNPWLVIADNRDGKVRFYPSRVVAESFKSTLTLRTEGWLLKPEFQDLNGDGLKDLLLPSIERIGIFTLLRIFFTSRFDIHYMIYFNRREPLFPLLPDIARSVSLPLSFSAGPSGVNVMHSLIYSFEGDYNGDGMNDFLCKCAPRKLGIYLGRKSEGFSLEPDRLIDFKSLEECSSASTRVFDLNGDGFSDILLHQHSIGRGEDRYDLFLSSKK